MTIHPWVDGNGSTARLLMNMMQMEQGLLPSILKKEHKAEYIVALALSQDREDSISFIEFMMRSMTEFIRHSIDEFKRQ